MKRLILIHPSRRRLREWLDTGQPEAVGDHVELCDRCADRLEQIDEAEPPVPDLDGSSALLAALTELVRPPSDLTERVLSGVERRQQSERELALLAGLFSVGVKTAQLLLDPEHSRGSAVNHNHHPEPHDGEDTVTNQEDDDRE